MHEEMEKIHTLATLCLCSGNAVNEGGVDDDLIDLNLHQVLDRKNWLNGFPRGM